MVSTAIKLIILIQMLKLHHVILLCYFCLIVFLLIDNGEANEKHLQKRQKRFLRFQNISHFFLRLNIKANMVPWNQIFAQALGFRMNWDDPPDSFHPYHRLHRRDVYKHLETLLDRNGLEGRGCIRRAICEIRMINQPSAVYHTILKMVFRITPETIEWHNITSDECQLYTNLCPFSVLDVALYTDL